MGGHGGRYGGGVERSEAHSSGYAVWSEMKAVVPDQLVTIAGKPIAIASITGRPHPSPRVGSTKASADAYLRKTEDEASGGDELTIRCSNSSRWDMDAEPE